MRVAVEAPRARATRMSPEKRRQQLLEAALHVFATKGINGASHTDLASYAQVSVPTTFHYFPTSEALINAVLAEVKRFLLEDIVAPRFDDQGSAPASVERILLDFYRAIDSHHNHIRVWFEWSVAVRQGLWEPYLDFYQSALAGINQLLERGRLDHSIPKDLDIDVASRVIVSVAHMIVQMKFAGNSEHVITHTIHSLMDQYFDVERLE